jgi:hypothetical protein
MQTANARYAVVAALLLAGALVYGAAAETHGASGARWPSDDGVYMSAPWSMGPLAIEQSANNTAIVTREYRDTNDDQATLAIVTSQAPKVYGPGAEVPFLGSGFTIEPAPLLVPLAGQAQIGALTAVRGQEQWLVIYAYGERCGLLGNGPRAWMQAALDGLRGSPNTYYKLYLLTRLDRSDPATNNAAAQLAATVFPDVAAWYAATPEGA